MNTEFMPVFQSILRREMAQDRPADQAALAVLRACAAASPDPRWTMLEMLRWDAELEPFARWFCDLLDHEPPHEAIEHWSACVPSIEDNPAEITLSGHPKYDHRKGSPCAEGVQWPADEDAIQLFESPLLDAGAALIGASPALRARFEESENWPEHLDDAFAPLYAVPLLYGAILARHAVLAAGITRLSPGGRAARITVTFVSGDDVEVGTLTPGGVWGGAPAPPAGA